MHAVDIIVIGYDLIKLETTCLSSVLCHTKYPYVLTYYDNYQDEYTLTQIWNKLIDRSSCDYICLLNNDTEVTPRWLTKMVHTLERTPTCGFVGPSTNNCHSPQKEIDTPEKASQYENVAVRMDQPISGFCLLFTRNLWRDLGGFDPKYKHYGQESDFIDRAKHLGYDSFWRKDSFVWHVGEASVKKSGMDVTAARNEAKKLYWETRTK